MSQKRPGLSEDNPSLRRSPVPAGSQASMDPAGVGMLLPPELRALPGLRPAPENERGMGFVLPAGFGRAHEPRQSAVSVRAQKGED
jgi:hypothetical protein